MEKIFTTKLQRLIDYLSQSSQAEVKNKIKTTKFSNNEIALAKVMAKFFKDIVEAHSKTLPVDKLISTAYGSVVREGCVSRTYKSEELDRLVTHLADLESKHKKRINKLKDKIKEEHERLKDMPLEENGKEGYEEVYSYRTVVK